MGRMPDFVDPIPHFTCSLGLELQHRLTARIVEDEVLGTPDPETLSWIPTKQAWGVAGDVVRRIYRTQLKEALFMGKIMDCFIEGLKKVSNDQPRAMAELRVIGRALQLKGAFSGKSPKLLPARPVQERRRQPQGFS